jgi:hypothetical protein
LYYYSLFEIISDEIPDFETIDVDFIVILVNNRDTSAKNSK